MLQFYRRMTFYCLMNRCMTVCICASSIMHAFVHVFVFGSMT